MALVPSGRCRVMRSQLFAQLDPSVTGQQSTQPQPQPDPRAQVEQEEMGNPQEQVPDGVDENTPEENAQQQVGESVPENQQVEKPGGENLGAESEIKEAWKKMLVELGVPDRLISNMQSKLYSQEIDLTTGTVRGHYMIPTFTEHQRINERTVLQLARKMQKAFGLVSTVKLEGSNWRVDFKTTPKTDLQDGGTSFDELMTGNGQKKEASAMTIGEMLDARRQELFETMRSFVPVKGK